MTDSDIRIIQETIVKTVNGKIDRLHENINEHNKKHENDMLEVREHMASVKPILDEYQEREAARAYAKKTGDGIKWLAGVVAAIGALWIVFMQLNPFK